MATIASRQLNMATTNTLIVAKRNEALTSGTLADKRDARRVMDNLRDRGQLAELHEREAASEINKQEKVDEEIYALAAEDDEFDDEYFASDADEDDERAPPSQSDDGWISNSESARTAGTVVEAAHSKKPWWSADVQCWKSSWTDRLLCRGPPTEDEMHYVMDPTDPKFGERVRIPKAPKPPMKQPWRCIMQSRATVYQMLDDPSSSYTARVVTVISLFFIVFSTLTFILETMPEFHRKNEGVWFGFEVATVSFFTVEYIARLVTCPNPIKFVVGPMNVIDLVAIAPFYIDLVVSAIEGSGGGSELFRVFRTVRLVRVFRIFKVSKYSSSIQIFFKTVQRGANALGLLMMYLLIACVVFASLAYFVERGEWDDVTRKYYMNGEVSDFQSIPASFWWAVTTVTATGYGDFVPVTFWGKLVATGAMISGLLVLSFPVSIIGATFTDLWFEKTLKQGIKKSTLHKPWVEDDPMEVFFFNLVTKANDVEIAQMAFEGLMEKAVQRVRHSRRLRLYIRRTGQPKTTHMTYALISDVVGHLTMLQEALGQARVYLNSVVWLPNPMLSGQLSPTSQGMRKQTKEHHSMMGKEKRNWWKTMKSVLIIKKKLAGHEDEVDNAAPPDQNLNDFIRIMVQGSKFKDKLDEEEQPSEDKNVVDDPDTEPDTPAELHKPRLPAPERKIVAMDDCEDGQEMDEGERKDSDDANEENRHHIGLWKRTGMGSLELLGDVRRLGHVARTNSFLASNTRQTSITAVIDMIAALKSAESDESAPQSAENSHRSFSLSTATAPSPGILHGLLSETMTPVSGSQTPLGLCVSIAQVDSPAGTCTPVHRQDSRASPLPETSRQSSSVSPLPEPSAAAPPRNEVSSTDVDPVVDPVVDDAPPKT